MKKVESDLRIIQLIDSISIGGGAERLVIDICKELLNRPAIEIRLVVLNDSRYYGDENEDLWEKKMPDLIKPNLCKSNLCFSFIGFSKSDSKQFDQFLHDFKPHVIHSHLIQSELISRNKLIPGVKYFTHLHDNMPLFKSFKFEHFLSRLEISNMFIKRWLIRRYKQSNNHFFSISQDTFDFFGKQLPNELSQNIISFPNAIDTSRFGLQESKVKLSELHINLLSIGSLVPKKNHVFLVRVVSKLVQLGYHPMLRILGDGSERHTIQSLIESLKLSKHVLLLGYTDTVEDEVKRADIYVHSATYEPFGISIVEAMASGLPVVCLNGRGNVSLIDEGKNGFLVDSMDVDEFVGKILLLNNNLLLLREMGEYAIQFAQKYDIKQYVDRLIYNYRSIS